MESLTLFVTGTLLAAGLYWFFVVYGSPERKGKLAVSLSAGSISDDKIQHKYHQYWSFFRRPEKTDTGEKEKVPDFVDTFYNLVTDIYEWGWGQSFHFARPIPGKSYKESTRAHEEMVADLLAVNPGDRILDVGCGVGGPMRTIAAHSRANVVGITINDYQVKRARIHNKKAGLDSQCEVVCGNFLQMPFSDGSFDGAYAIEATCHAPRLEDVYGEVYRVLKPGSVFVSLEWVSTEKYDAGNPEQVKIVEEIARGNALPGVKAYDDVAKAAKKVGFEVLKEEDLAKPPALPWWDRLKIGRIAYQRNHILLTILSALRIAPKGTLEVHEMLVEAADYLSRAGDAGIFSPMHLIVCRKPESSKSC